MFSCHSGFGRFRRIDVNVLRIQPHLNKTNPMTHIERETFNEHFNLPDRKREGLAVENSLVASSLESRNPKDGKPQITFVITQIMRVIAFNYETTFGPLH